MLNCQHGNTVPERVVTSLPESQAGPGRHKCVVCAYARGSSYTGELLAPYRCSHGNVAPSDLLEALPDSQAGIRKEGAYKRHFCACCAFAAGLRLSPEIIDAEAAIEERAGRPSHQRYQESVEVRLAVERRAMVQATESLSSAGWRVRDVSANESYDLHCERGSEELRVEVKGTQSDGLEVLLTRNEVEHARNQYPGVALYVLSGIVVSKKSGRVEASGGEEKLLIPWRIDDGTLVPLGFAYTVPTTP